MSATPANPEHYYVPHGSFWPVLGAVGILTLLVGFANWLHMHWYGPYIFSAGALIIAGVAFGWFGTVIRENQKGVFNAQVDRSFRWGMGWFIFSEVCFFGAFFAALFYARLWILPVMGGEYHPMTHLLLWPDFNYTWPLFVNPDNQRFVGADDVIPAWGVPALNTLILLTSGVTITWAHWALKLNKYHQLVAGLALTILLGMLFLGLQAYEYIEAYAHYNLTLESGIYGTTFFMLTGFHGLHVTIGTLMLIVILGRAIVRHFSPHNHFAFEAVAWYWHFVDVVWLFLFVFVYWL